MKKVLTGLSLAKITNISSIKGETIQFPAPVALAKKSVGKLQPYKLFSPNNDSRPAENSTP